MEVETEDTEPSYFFEQVEQNAKDKTRVDIDSVKHLLSQQRRIFRDTGGRKEFLEILESSSFDCIYKNIDIDLKQLKDKNKKLKQKSNHKKEENRRTRRDNEKLIAEIFKLNQEITNKKLHLDQLNSESLALKNKQQKKIIVNNNKYNINSLIDETQCKNIINNQNNTLNNVTNNINNKKKTYDIQKQNNNKLIKKNEILTKKLQSFKDIHQIQTQMNTNNNNTQFIELKKQLESIKRLFSIIKLEINNNMLFVEYKNNNKIYKIQIEIETYSHNKYGIKSLDILNENNTKLNAICEWIMRYKYDMDNNLIRAPIIVIKRVIIQVLLCLRKLHLRYNDIKKVFDIYGGNDGMLPWLPENGQLVFKFSFKQKLKHNNNNNMDIIDIDVPLVVSVSWNYPQNKFIMDDCVVKIEHYNCNLRDRNMDNNDEKWMDIENKWKNMLEKVVCDVKGKFQNDIVGYVNFIYNKLKRFADVEQ